MSPATHHPLVVTVEQFLRTLVSERLEAGLPPGIPLNELLDAGVGVVAEDYAEVERLVYAYFNPPRTADDLRAEAAELRRYVEARRRSGDVHD